MGDIRPVAMNLLAHPVTQSVALPLVIGVVGLALTRLSSAVPLKGAILTAAVLACVLAMLGMPPWPPRSGMQKLPFLLSAAVLAAVALESFDATGRMRAAVASAFTVGALCWLAWPVLRDGQPASVAALAAGALVSVAVVVRRARVGAAPEFVLVLFAGAVGLSATALVAASLALAQASGALAAALGLVSAWLLVARAVPGITATLTWGVVALAMLAALTALLTPAPGSAMALLAMLCVADLPFARREAGARRTVMMGGLAFVLAAAMVAVTVALSDAAGSAGDPYY